MSECEWRAGGRAEAADTELKTKTPHVNVGNKLSCFISRQLEPRPAVELRVGRDDVLQKPQYHTFWLTIPASWQVIHSQAFSTIKHSQVVSQLGPHCKSSSIPKPSQGKACQSLSFRPRCHVVHKMSAMFTVRFITLGPKNNFSLSMSRRAAHSCLSNICP